MSGWGNGHFLTGSAGGGGGAADGDTLGDLTPTDGNFAVGDGAAWVAESGATARTSIGLGTANTATFAAVVAPSLDRSDAGALAIGGTNATSVVVRGGATFNSAGRLTLPDGTSGTPSIAGSDADSGLYLGGTTTSIYSNNSQVFLVTTTGFGGLGGTFNGVKRSVRAPTVDTTINATFNNFEIQSNTGASAEVILSLPTAASGLEYEFIVNAAQLLRVKAATGDVIRGDIANDGTIVTSASAGYVRSNEVGAVVRLVAVDATTWQIMSVGGSWTVDS